VQDVALDGCERPLDPHRIEVRLTKQANTELQRAERLPPLVCGHARELVEALRLIGDRLRVQTDEPFHRRLRQRVDGLM
jgi:hypothetical protein